MRLRHAFAALAVLAVAVTAPLAADDAARTNAPAPQGDGIEADRIEQGRALYGRHCLHCHGLNMVNPGTVTFDLREFPHDAKQRFVESVTRGKNNRMPPWGDVLTPDDIDALWAYVRTGGKG